jgi:ubiquitin
VKYQIQGKEGIPKIKQRLFFADEQLEDGSTIADYNIQSFSTLVLHLVTVDVQIDSVAAGSAQIFVTTPSGKTITLSVEASDTIDSVKYQIQGKDGVTRKHQRLLFADEQVEDNRTITDCSIKSGSRLDLLIVGGGGGKRGRVGVGADHDKQSQLASLRTEYEMKARMLRLCDIPYIAAFSVEVENRRDHNGWFNGAMTAQTNQTLTELRDNITKSSNSSQRNRFLVKIIFEQQLDWIAKAEHTLKILKGMPDGLMDSYMSFVVANRWMLADGTVDWSALTKEMDVCIANRHRDEGRVAPPPVPMHLG